MDRYRMLPSYRYYDVEGTSPLTLDKSAGKPLRDYKIYGVEAGVGDKSKNLFDISKITTNTQITNNGDGSITTIGYPGGTNKKLSQLCPELKVGDIVTISGETDASSNGEALTQVYLYHAEGGVTWKYGQSLTITQKHLDSYLMFYCIRVGTGSTAITTPAYHKNIQVEYGATATEYEPYGYRVPVISYGKNLFDIDKFINATGNAAYYAKNDNGELVMLKGDYRDMSQVRSYPIELPAGTYKLSFSDSSFVNYYVFANGVKIGNSTFTLTEPTNVTFKAWGANNTVLGYAQIEIGNVATLYEPHKKPIVTAIYLDEPLADGEYLDYKRQRVVKSDSVATLYLPQINTHKGTNVITVGAEIPPSNMQIQYYK